MDLVAQQRTSEMVVYKIDKLKINKTKDNNNNLLSVAQHSKTEMF